MIEVKNKIENVALDQLPLILALNSGAEPIGWIDYEDSAYYYSLGKVLWSIGKWEVTLRGGINAATGERSLQKIDSIIALANGISPFSYRKNVPTLTNKSLFVRDRNMCAYCGNLFRIKELTRDHVIPTSRGGLDIWENVVAACKPCNSMKDNLLLSEIKHMELLYAPYAPNYHESLILKNKKLLADQMEFLMRGVHKDSRLRENIH